MRCRPPRDDGNAHLIVAAPWWSRMCFARSDSSAHSPPGGERADATAYTAPAGVDRHDGQHREPRTHHDVVEPDRVQHEVSCAVTRGRSPPPFPRNEYTPQAMPRPQSTIGAASARPESPAASSREGPRTRQRNPRPGHAPRRWPRAASPADHRPPGPMRREISAPVAR